MRQRRGCATVERGDVGGGVRGRGDGDVEGWKGRGYCAFSSELVAPPILGRLYA
jgi:hypothetical protein